MKITILITIFLLICRVSGAQEYPVQITDEGYIIVEVKLLDTIKANFILDTGAGAIVLSGKTFEKVKDHAVNSGYFTGFRNDGDRIDGEIYKIPSLAIGDIIEENVLIGIYPPLDEYGVDGLVSLKFFEDKPFNIDFRNKTIKFLGNEKELYNDGKHNVLPISLQTHTDFSLDMFIRICLDNGVSVNAEFDTGSGYNSFYVNPYFINRLDLDRSEMTSRIYTTPVSGNKLSEYIHKLNSVFVCPDKDNSPGKKITDVPFVFREGLIYEALIGSFLFKDSNITIDIPDRKIVIAIE